MYTISTFTKFDIDNLKATSTTLLTYISNLTNPSTLNTNNLNVSGTARFHNVTTINSSLNVSGITTLNNVNIQGNLDVKGTTTIIDTVINNTSMNSLSVLVNIVQNAIWNDGVNYALNVSGYSMFGGVQINGQDTNNIYKRVGDLIIASPIIASLVCTPSSLVIIVGILG